MIKNFWFIFLSFLTFSFSSFALTIEGTEDTRPPVRNANMDLEGDETQGALACPSESSLTQEEESGERENGEASASILPATDVQGFLNESLEGIHKILADMLQKLGFSSGNNDEEPTTLLSSYLSQEIASEEMVEEPLPDQES